MVTTVKKYKDLLEEMKTVYPYNDEETTINYLVDMVTRCPRLEIQTKEEKTGITITMSKGLNRSDCE